MTMLERLNALAASTGQTNKGNTNTGARIWFARATGISASTVGRWGADDWPEYAIAILDCLEAMPVDDWPERFR